MICVYADESCKDNHRFLILGGVCLCNDDAVEIQSGFKRVRDKHSVYGEVKWGKISRSKYDFYQEYINLFFEFCSRDLVHFHFLSVDTSTFKNRIYNEGCPELGFDKLIYQLLMHKFGVKYGVENKIQVYLDERTTKYDPNRMTGMLNAALKKKLEISYEPFTKITFQNSKTSELLQVNDLLIGAIGFRKNERHLKLDSSKLKIEFSEFIDKKSLMLEYPNALSSRQARRFTSWDFKFR